MVSSAFPGTAGREATGRPGLRSSRGTPPNLPSAHVLSMASEGVAVGRLEFGQGIPFMQSLPCFITDPGSPVHIVPDEARVVLMTTLIMNAFRAVQKRAEVETYGQ